MDYNQNLFGEKVEVEREEEAFDFKKALPDFNIFSLTDAFASRKKKDAWILYQKALAAWISPDEVYFKLFWQTKTLLLAKKTKTAEEAEMKAYPYSKAKDALKNFKEGELEKLSEDLMIGYHRVRRGEEEMETFVERVLLSI